MIKPLDHGFILQQWRDFAAQTHTDIMNIKRFVYLHSPCCASKCKYCMYESDIAASPARIRAGKQVLLDEITATAPAVQGLEFDGMYFGGGTPTIFSEQDFGEILTSVRQAFRFGGNGVSTCEMHPCSATEEKIALAAANGVNRISFGVQSLTPRVLKMARRMPADADRVASLIRMARKHGIKETSVDLIALLPGETMNSQAASIRDVLRCEPDSLVLYNFQYHFQSDKTSYTAEEMAQAVHDAMDWPQIRDACVKQALAAGYRPAPGTSGLITSVVVHRDTALYRQDNKYELFSRAPTAVLGLGTYSYSNVFGKVFYKNTGTRDMASGRSGNMYSGFLKTLVTEALDMVFLHIRDRIPLAFRYFESVFHFGCVDFIKEHFETLLERGHVSLSPTHFASRMKFRDESQFWEFKDLMMDRILYGHGAQQGGFAGDFSKEPGA